MFRWAKERAQDRLYRDARVFITVAKEDARALRPHNPLQTGDHIESLGREFNQPMGTMFRLRGLYRKTYWDTLCRVHGRTAVVHMVREDSYRRSIGLSSR